MLMDKLKIAVVQMKIIDGNIKYNIEKIKNYLNRIYRENVDLICFPELSVYGYDYNLINQNCKNNNAYKKLNNILRDLSLKVPILIGNPSVKDDKIYDSVVIFKDGEIDFSYNKMHLWDSERSFFEDGKDIDIYDFNGFKIGVGICADIGFPELSRIMAIKEADILIFPSAWAAPYEGLWQLMLRARAAENQVYTIGVNRVGEGKGIKYCGFSTFVNPSGEIEESIENGEGIMICNIYKEKIERRRNEIPWLSYRKPKNYFDILK
jgi:predicted amidohydrolase